jgi:lactocepin
MTFTLEEDNFLFKRSLSILALFLLVFTAPVSAAKLPDPSSGSNAGKKNQESILKLKKEDV